MTHGEHPPWWTSRPAALLAPVVVMGALFVASSIPGGISRSCLPPHADKAFHFLTHAVLGALLWRAASRGWGAGSVAALLAASVLGTTHGAFDEWHQSFVPGRDPSLADLLADTLGVLVGATLLAWRWRCSRQP